MHISMYPEYPEDWLDEKIKHSMKNHVNVFPISFNNDQERLKYT